MPRKQAGGIGSEAAVRKALERREIIAATLETLRARMEKTKLAQQIAELEEEDGTIAVAIDEYVLDKYNAGDGYDDGRYRFTKVVGHTRRWNVERLRELLKPSILRQVTTLVVVPEKIDELEAQGKIDLDAISDAYETRANKPYVKKTERTSTDDERKEEATSLAAKLG